MLASLGRSSKVVAAVVAAAFVIACDDDGSSSSAGGGGEAGASATGAGGGGSGGAGSLEERWSVAVPPCVVAVDAVSGDALLAGGFSETLSLGPRDLLATGDGDVFVGRLRTNGNWAWAVRLGGPGVERATAIAVSPSGEAVVAGVFDQGFELGSTSLTNAGGSDVFVVRLDPYGTVVSAARLGSSANEEPVALAVDDSGAVVVVGSVDAGTTDACGSLNSGGDAAMFVAKLDAGGGCVSSRVFAQDVGAALGVRGAALDPAGSLLLTGGYQGTVDLGVGPLTAASNDIWIAKLDSALATQWARVGGAAAVGSAIAADASGGVLVAGDFTGETGPDFGDGPAIAGSNTNALFVRLDADGEPVAMRSYGGEGYEEARGVATDSAGRAVVAGGFRSSLSLGDAVFEDPSAMGDAFVALLDDADEPRLAMEYGDDAEMQSAQAVFVDAAGNLTLHGTFVGAIDFGGGPLRTGTAMHFIARLKPSGL